MATLLPSYLKNESVTQSGPHTTQMFENSDQFKVNDGANPKRVLKPWAQGLVFFNFYHEFVKKSD